MNYIKLGNTGLQVSRLCPGCMSCGQAKTPGMLTWPWTLSEEDSRPFIKRAVELGVNFFDTANVYSISLIRRRKRSHRTIGAHPIIYGVGFHQI